jgi:hypothetical protein
MDNKAKPTKIKLTGLWEKKLSSEESMFTGSLSPTAKIVIFKNNFKGKDSDPDYLLYLEPVMKEAVEEQEETDPPSVFDYILEGRDWRSHPDCNNPLLPEDDYI